MKVSSCFRMMLLFIPFLLICFKILNAVFENWFDSIWWEYDLCCTNYIEGTSSKSFAWCSTETNQYPEKNNRAEKTEIPLVGLFVFAFLNEKLSRGKRVERFGGREICWAQPKFSICLNMHGLHK